MRANVIPRTPSDPLASPVPDEALVQRVLDGELDDFALLMRRYNQRLYRVAHAIVRDATEAEDVVQHAYLSAYAHLHTFAGQAAFSTWLTRIVINEALVRHRRRLRVLDLQRSTLAPDWCSGSADARSPEEQVSRAELVRLLEAAIDALPASYRAIVVLREVEGLSTQQAAEHLAISEEAVRVRLHRARALLRATLWERASAAARDVFAIGGARCTAIVERVLGRLRRVRS